MKVWSDRIYLPRGRESQKQPRHLVRSKWRGVTLPLTPLPPPLPARSSDATGAIVVRVVESFFYFFIDVLLRVRAVARLACGVRASSHTHTHTTRRARAAAGAAAMWPPRVCNARVPTSTLRLRPEHAGQRHKHTPHTNHYHSIRPCIRQTRTTQHARISHTHSCRSCRCLRLVTLSLYRPCELGVLLSPS